MRFVAATRKPEFVRDAQINFPVLTGCVAMFAALCCALLPPPRDRRNQEFMLPVPDPAAAQLEFTIWDEEDKEVSWFGVHVLTLREGRGRRKLTDRMFHRAQAQGYSNFLGEVLLNLARLAPYKGHYIEQLFYIKQGKTIVTEEQASGNLKLGLRLDIPDSFAPQASPPVASPPVAEADSRAQEEKRRQAEEEQKKQEELRRLAEEQAAAAAAAEQRRKLTAAAAERIRRRDAQAKLASTTKKSHKRQSAPPRPPGI